MRTHLTLALTALCFASCLTPMGSVGLSGANYARTPAWVTEHSSNSYDQFSGVTKIESPRVKAQLRQGYLIYPSIFWLRSLRTTDQEVFQIYIIAKEHDWAFYDRAIDDTQYTMDVNAADRRVITGDLLEEHLIITLPSGYLEDVVARGGRGIKLYGDRNSGYLYIHHSLASGFLEYVDLLGVQ